MAIVAGCNDTLKGSKSDLVSLGNTRVRQMASRLAGVDKGADKSKPVAMWIMPAELREISGLALTADGRILAHDDEVAKVYVIDPRRGILLKQFTLGTGMRGDFESITVAGRDIYMLESSGVLYQFQEGADGAGVPYSAVDLHLGKECEFEGMVYQADSNWLVMPCKTAKDKSLSHHLVIYRWKLSGPDSEKLSMVTIPFSQLIGTNKWKNLHPSDITIDPATGNFVMISSHENALIEMTQTGDLVRSEPLPSGHNQPEGVAITKDSILMISDEATRKPAAIILYRWHPSQKPDSIQ
ncbi:MAG TPA: SdiA-regulated domain-containing protein, partial [Gemmatimonadaceae bacterium]|nr:SdiA-regulated domain-containing protein [Gemmatimonadaceae bacterium]